MMVDYLRRKDRGISVYAALKGREDIVISFVTVTELYSGKSSREREGKGVIEDLLTGVEVKYADFDRSKMAGELRRDYQLSLGDSFVAQLALDQDLEVATLDKKAFSRVLGLKFYGVEGKRKGE